MTQQQREDAYQFARRHFALFISVVTSTAVAVFFALNYINSPISNIEIHLSSIDTQLQNIESAHMAYGKLSADQATAIIEINQNLARITQALQDRGILK